MENIKIELCDFQVKNNDKLNEYINTQNGFIPMGINMTNAPMYWLKGYTGKDIKIAVIDTGCVNHPDLTNNIIGGKNFTNEGKQNDYTDLNGHGSHVCGTICANGKIKGIAPNAKLLILKALDKSGNGSMLGIVNAIEYAIQQKVDIISLSLGCKQNVPQLETVVKNAIAKNIVVVVASGNDGDNNANTNEIDYPAGYTEVISVGAIDNTRLGATFSNSNNQIDCVASGINVLSIGINNNYVEMSGTSMATPHVTGTIALLMEKFIKEWGRRPTYLETYSQLIKNTMDLGINKNLQGNGMIFLK